LKKSKSYLKKETRLIVSNGLFICWI